VTLPSGEELEAHSGLGATMDRVGQRRPGRRLLAAEQPLEERRLLAAGRGPEHAPVYDITAQRVTLPSGEELEAHSGLGATMDDPRYVHLRMRGVRSSPPGAA
jgi:hypothetical protein